MKLLSIHADFIEFEAKKKALKSAEEADKKPKKVKECLVVFTAVERQDENNVSGIVKKYIKEIEDIAKQVKTKTIVLYPYAHLSSDLSSPKNAEEVMKKAEKLLTKKYKVTRAPFGWYKSFDISCKGHPLSELSREFGVGSDKSSPKSEEEKYNPKKLLSQLSRSRLDTSKLKDNDHRILGQKLDLFSFHDSAPGMVFLHDKGLTIYNGLINFMKEEHRKADYQEISTPQILDKKLWQISGHWEKYQENIFLTKYEKRDFAVKPMNCPGGMLVYKTSSKAYRDLPLRIAEMGIVHRQELSGVLAGLFRVIKFTQDDAHVFCTEDQLEDELKKIMELIDHVYKTFNFEYRVELSIRPKKRIGSDKIWDQAEKALESVLKKEKIKYKLNKGDGAFYGPKIDFHIKDSLNRTWQCATVQLDFAMPERFELEYVDSKNKRLRPIMIHRAIFGSLERFMGILLEHTNGRLPLWLSPVQVKIITVTNRNVSFAKKVLAKMKEKGIRVELNDETETMGRKVRQALVERVNYIVTIGDKEVEKKKLAVKCGDGKVKFGVDVDKFIGELLGEIKKK